LLGAGPQVLKFFDINKKQNVLNVDDLNLQNLAITLADGASGAADLRHFKLKLSVIDLNDNVDYAVFDLKYPQNSFSGVDVTVDDKINISVSGSKNLLSYNLYVSDDFDIPFENTDDFVDIKSYRATKNIIYYPKKNTRYHYNLIASDLYGTGASYYFYMGSAWVLFQNTIEGSILPIRPTKVATDSGGSSAVSAGDIVFLY